MHESARRGLLRLLSGVGVLAAGVLLVVLLVRGCRSEEEIVSEAVDDARDALVERHRADFLAFFADDVRYRGKSVRADLERDLDRWIEARIGWIMIQDRRIEVTDGNRASIRLKCDVGNVFQTYATVDVDLAAEKQGGEWKVTSFDWK